MESKRANPRLALLLDSVARPERFERPTPWFVAKYADVHSYPQKTE
jgi:hypothetical protein